MPRKRTMMPVTCVRCGQTRVRPVVYSKKPPKFCDLACRALPLADRFWPKVAIVNAPGACWEWQAGKYQSGYGILDKGYAHRVAWELASKAPIPAGMDIGHICDNPGCVRNDDEGVYDVDGVLYPRWGHLFMGPAIANMLDMAQKGRWGNTVFLGEANGAAKVTDAVVLAIRARYAQGGITQTQLAREYGIRQDHVSDIVLRVTWRHV